MNPRFGNKATYGGLVVEKFTPAYASTITVTIAPDTYKAVVVPAQLTGALAINATAAKAQLGDELLIVVSADGSNRVVTLGTGFTQTTQTITVTANTTAILSFVHDGTAFSQISATA